MFVTSQSHAKPEFELFVQELILENTRYKRELRSSHREVLVTPVTVFPTGGIDEGQHCVSRNISPAGISLISSEDFNEKLNAILEIYRLKKGPTKQIVAECRWCKPFGEEYWMSGWQFQRLQFKY